MEYVSPTRVRGQRSVAIPLLFCVGMLLTALTAMVCARSHPDHAPLESQARARANRMVAFPSVH